MRKIVAASMLILVLSSCFSLPSDLFIPTTTATSTITVTVTPSITPSPTPTPTFTPSPTFTSSPVPTVPPKEIDVNDRLYIDITHSRQSPRVLVPFGLHRNSAFPFQEDFPGITTYYLTGILLELPQVDQEENLIFKLGIPNQSLSDYNILYLKRKLFRHGDSPEHLTLLVARLPINLKGDGFRLAPLQGVLHETIDVEQFINESTNAVGRQIAVTVDVANNSQTLGEFYKDELENSPCRTYYPCIRDTRQLVSETEYIIEIAGYILNNNPKYNNETLRVTGIFFLPVSQLR